MAIRKKIKEIIIGRELSVEEKKIFKMLEDEKNKLEKEITKLKKFYDYGTADSENAQEIEEFSGQIGLKSKLDEGLSEVKLAIKKIKKGTYGVCSKCNKKIDPKRMIANKSASYCVSCKNNLKVKIVKKWYKFPWMKR
ncbi:hypothetical protein CO100_02220 [Candidatus Berkelbacteria bacterium CG_4_9_14_3_um_filter_33_5]|nr:MAG: hypothetical protein COT76_01625 [Candidatus Berkelbacteria bacterium CG10_big_fil_rev_8_21_14_0_10_33_10]PJB51349.1 MAG: hypothetical protein CO100_02220 [Candidatus Berkelbacteria bacterium CG_4_9_14_3_um_filter_33_5]